MSDPLPADPSQPLEPQTPDTPPLSNRVEPTPGPDESIGDELRQSPGDRFYPLPLAAHVPADFHLLPPPPPPASPQEVQRELSDEQIKVLAQLAAGQSVTAAAEALSLHRSTVYRWLNNDPAFRAAYNAWRKEVMELGRSRLLKGSEAAIDTVLGAVAKGDARIAMGLLKGLRFLERPKVGSADVNFAGTEQELDRRAERVKVARRSRRIFNDERMAFPHLTDESIERIKVILDGGDPDANKPPPYRPTDPKVLDQVRQIVDDALAREAKARYAPPRHDPDDFGPAD